MIAQDVVRCMMGAQSTFVERLFCPQRGNYLKRVGSRSSAERALAVSYEETSSLNRHPCGPSRFSELVGRHACSSIASTPKFNSYLLWQRPRGTQERAADRRPATTSLGAGFVLAPWLIVVRNLGGRHSHRCWQAPLNVSLTVRQTEHIKSSSAGYSCLW